MNREEFEILANSVWRKLQPLIPDELKAHFHKFSILIEDRPSAHLLKELADTDLAEEPDELCGLYMGTPLPDSLITERSIFPDRIYLFRKALLEFSEYDATEEGLLRLQEEIAITLLHEVGHFFGLDEDDLERLGFD